MIGEVGGARAGCRVAALLLIMVVLGAACGGQEAGPLAEEPTAAPTPAGSASSPSPHPYEPCPEPKGPDLEPGEREVAIFYFCRTDDPDASPMPARRYGDAGEPEEMVARAVRELLEGTTEGEKDRGFHGLFERDVSDLVEVRLEDDGTVVLDFDRRIRELQPSFTTNELRGFSVPIIMTVYQFRWVEQMFEQLEGDCEAFARWTAIDEACPSSTQEQYERHFS